MRTESARDNLGGHAMLNALSTALFALTLRLASEAEEAPRRPAGARGPSAPGTRIGGDVPGAGAARGRCPNWPASATCRGRPLARHFQETLGRSASDLLTDIRMTLAANELKKPSISTGAVAETVGYQSEAAFQRAFKQHMGMTPAHWRRAAQSPDEAGKLPSKA